MSLAELADRAWAEFAASGALTDAVGELVLKLTAAVARFGTTRPPGDHRQWTREAVDEAANSFLAHERTSQRFTTIRARTTDGRSFRLQLEAAIKNWLNDEARRTNIAHIIQRIRDVMTGTSPFRRIEVAGGAAWTVTDEDSTGEIFAGRPDDLMEVARRIPGLTRTYWHSERRDPIADADDLRQLLKTVLEHAGQPVNERLLADVVADRFAVNAGPDAIPMPPDSDAWRPHTTPSDDSAATVALEAEALWPTLDDRTRIVLAVGDDANEIGKALDLSRSQSYEVRADAIHTLKDLLGEHPDGQEIVDHLADVAQAWLAARLRGTSSRDNNT